MFISSTKKILLFNELEVVIPITYWDFLCENRFFSINPTPEEIQAEFVTGTGITKNKKDMWSEATLRFLEYIEDLMDIKNIDVNAMARDLIQNERKHNASP